MFGKKVPGGETESPEPLTPEPTEGTPFYKNPVVILVGVGLLATGVYFATRPKKVA
jgi:hypothetical protein